MATIDDVLDAIDENLDRSVERLFDFVRIPSVSNDPSYARHCRRAADWLADALRGLGFTASVRETGGHPAVIARRSEPPADGVPRILFYGHYDVQPPDPLDEWLSPPFEPARLKDEQGVERLFGRGMADDKGQIWTFIEACRAFVEVEGRLPLDVTLLIEGEEEAGSPNLAALLESAKRELACDAAFVCDTEMWDAATPAIITRLKGLFHERITVTGPDRDLHSGLYGGSAANPLRVLAGLLTRLHDADGLITIPGFYDDVDEVSPELLAQWRALDFSEEKFFGDVGLSVPVIERGRSVLEQLWGRPAVDVNGIQGGNAGPGERSVLPSTATARLSFRLVARQDPETIRRAFRSFARSMLPADCRIAFDGGASSGATILPENDPILAKAAKALSEEWGRDTVLKGSGGTIPVVRHLKDILGLDSVLVGFGLAGNAIHAPNENYDLEGLRKGARSWARILHALSLS